MDTQIINTPGFVPPPMILMEDKGRTVGTFLLEKYRARQRKSGNDIVAPEPFEIIKFHNLLTNAGAALLEDLLIGAGGTTYANANAYIGVGNGTTAVSAAHTDLQGASKTRKAMQATYPSRASQTLTFVSIFATSDANYSWEEMAIFNGSSGNTMHCRGLVAAPFTKTSSLSITSTYTWSVA